MKSRVLATTLSALAAVLSLGSAPTSSGSSVADTRSAASAEPSTATFSEALASPVSARKVETGKVVTVDGRVPKRLARGTATLLRIEGGTRQRVGTARVDARRRYVLRAPAPLLAGRYSYEVSVRVQGAVKTVQRFKLTVVDPNATPTPVPTGPKGASNDWTYLDGSRVARWDPCSTITWSVEGSAPYAGSQADLDTAFARISAATGLTFVQVADPAVSTFDVVWTNAAAAPELAGSVVGFGGFSSYAQTNGPSKVVDGSVLLDAEHTLPAGFSAIGASWGKVMLHEMTHAVGLGHAAGEEQIMFPKVVATAAEFGAGDLAGLQAVGAGQGCFPADATQGRSSAPALSSSFWE